MDKVIVAARKMFNLIIKIKVELDQVMKQASFLRKEVERIKT
jgi:hypothetical protein